MAKGPGWAMAEYFGSLKVAHLVGQIVICPICGGPMTVGSMTEQFKCRGGKEGDMPSWLRDALKGQKYEPWQYYPQDGAITVLATAANGVALTAMRDRGLFGGWQWDGVPEGEVTFPDWFPTAERDQYVAARFAAWNEELVELLKKPDVQISEEELQKEHPYRLILRAEGQVESAAQARKAAAEREAERKADQERVTRALTQDGFFEGRLGRAALPEGVTIIRRDSMGDRSDPHLLMAASRMNLDQLRALVQALGDFSEVQIQGRTVCIVSSNPGRWIGRGGSTIKALGQALSRYIRVVEKKQ